MSNEPCHYVHPHPSDSVTVTVTNVTLTDRQNAYETVRVSIKGAACKPYADGDRVVLCEQAFNKIL